MAAPYQPALKASSEENEVRRSEEVLYWTRLKQVAVFSEPSAVTSVAMSCKQPNTIATTAGVRLSIFNSVLCEQTAVMTRFKKAVTGVTFRGDGTLIAIGGDEGKLRIFDQFTGNTPRAPLRSWRVAACSVHAVRFGAVGGRSVYSLADDGVLKQWDFSSTGGAPLATIKAHADASRVLVPSATNEHMVLTGGYDHTVKVWDVRCPGEDGPSLSFDAPGPVESALFLPREQIVAVSAGPTVKLFDITSGGRCLQSLTAHHKTITSMCLVRGGQQMLTASIDKRMNVVRTADLSLIHSSGLASPIMGIAATPDDSKVAVGMGSLLALLRREEAPTDAVLPIVGAGGAAAARKTYVPKGAIRAATVEKRGEKEVETVEPSAKVASEYKLSHEDTLLRRYRHAALVTRVFTNKAAKAESMPDVVVGWLTVIVSRKAMGRALAGQQSTILINATRFVSRHLFKFHYFDTLSAVAESLFEVCADAPLQPALTSALIRLREAIARELGVQKELAQTIGALEMLTAPVSSGVVVEAEEEEDMDELFGEPVFSVIPLSMSEEKEEKEEKKEEEEKKAEENGEEEEKMEVDLNEQENAKTLEEPKSSKKKKEKKRSSLGGKK